MTTLHFVQNNLNKVLRHLQPLLPLANCHMVNFLTGDFWNNFITSEIRKEYEVIGLSGMYKILWHFTKNKSYQYEDKDYDIFTHCPALCNYFFTASTICLNALGEISLSHKTFQDKLISLGYILKEDFSVKEFMSPKKLHEVQMMSQVVAALSSITNSLLIVDVGGGKGYLSSILALQHGLQVLGIDSSHINTHGAAKRTEKLQKYWPGLCRRAVEKDNSTIIRRGKHWKSKTGGTYITDSSADEGEVNVVETKHEPQPMHLQPNINCTNLYKQATSYVTNKTDIRQVIEENFPDSSSHNVTLVGLHTCGNLAATCLKLFTSNESIKAICNVGCCYHLIEEEFAVNPCRIEKSSEEDIEYGFPMSHFLCSQKFALRRNARMLAAQAIDRLSEKDEIPVKPLFFRALLQVLLLKKYGEDRSDWQVGRIANKCDTFSEYVIKSAKKLNMDLEVQ